MFTHYTDHTRKILQVAEMQARRLESSEVCTGAVLIALVAEDTSAASEVLKTCGFDLRKLRQAYADLGLAISQSVTTKKLPYSICLEEAIEKIATLNKLPKARITPKILANAILQVEDSNAQIMVNHLAGSLEELHLKLNPTQ